MFGKIKSWIKSTFSIKVNVGRRAFLGGLIAVPVVSVLPQLPVPAPVSTYDPVLLPLIRRVMPQLIAYDLCGVQPMTGPTGQIFTMKPRYGPYLPPPTPIQRRIEQLARYQA